MEIQRVLTQRAQIDLSATSSSGWGPNRVDLLTGPNGSGKTEVLTALVEQFHPRSRKQSHAEVVWKIGTTTLHSGIGDPLSQGPSRVIAQTFSPFTRFPGAVAEARRPSLSSIYTDGKSPEARYVCVGLNRSSRNVGVGISRRILEEAIYRLSETRETVGTVFDVLQHLDLEDGFTFSYEAGPALRALQEQSSEDAIAEKLVSNEIGRAGSSVLSELQISGRDEVVSLLSEALRQIGPAAIRPGQWRHHFSTRTRGTSDFAMLQSLALLRRLNLLRLTGCNVTTMRGRELDVASTSSGEQQLLCSIIGLATSVRRESLVLIDEPELSLHPRWQLTYLEHLKAVLEPFEGCHVLIATHSPLIVQKGIAMQAGVVQLKSGHRDASHVTSNSVDATLAEVFDTPVPDSTHLANQLFSAIADAESGSADDQVRSRRDLLRLKALYADPELSDPLSVSMIDDALKLLDLGEKIA